MYANRKLMVWFVTFGSNHFLPGPVAKKKKEKKEQQTNDKNPLKRTWTRSNRYKPAKIRLNEKKKIETN